MSDLMTEAEWFASNDPVRMIEKTSFCPTWTLRKQRLWACACCRLYWGELNGDCRKGVEVGEFLSDGGMEESKNHHFKILQPRWCQRSNLITAAGCCCHDSELVVLRGPAHLRLLESGETSEDFKSLKQADLLREVLDNPFNPIPSLYSYRVSLQGNEDFSYPTWLAWRDETPLRMARAFYEERRWEELPVLADALEDAGCEEERIIRHLRSPGPHVLGCWAVDLLLGKE